MLSRCRFCYTELTWRVEDQSYRQAELEKSFVIGAFCCNSGCDAAGQPQLELKDLRTMLFTSMVEMPQIPLGTVLRADILLERPLKKCASAFRLEIVAITLDKPVRFAVYDLTDLWPHTCPTRLTFEKR